MNYLFDLHEIFRKLLSSFALKFPFAFRCELDLICNLPHHLLQYIASNFLVCRDVKSRPKLNISFFSLPPLTYHEFLLFEFIRFSSNFLARPEFPNINKFLIFSDKEKEKKFAAEWKASPHKLNLRIIFLDRIHS